MVVLLLGCWGGSRLLSEHFAKAGFRRLDTKTLTMVFERLV